MSNLRWILRKAAGHKPAYAIVIGLALLDALLPLFSIGLQKYVIDDVLLAQKFELLAPFLGALVAAMIASDCLYSAALAAQVRLRLKVCRALILEYMGQIHRMPMPKLRNKQTGQLMQHINGDIEQVSALIAVQTPGLAKAVVELTAALVVIGWAAPPMLAVAAAVGPVYLVAGRLLGPRLKRIAKQKQQQKAELAAQMEESISGTREVVSFHRRQWEAAAFRSAFGRYFQTVMTEGKWINIQALASEPPRGIFSLAVLAYGGHAVMNGTMSPGTLVVAYQLTSRLIDSLQKTYETFSGFIAATSSIERYVEATVEMADRETGESRFLPGRISSIRFEQVAFKYEGADTKTLNGMTVEWPVGKKIAIVGPSGSGKSTVAQLLIRFVEPTEGRVRVNGIPLGDVEREEWTGRVGIVLQEPFLYPDTIRANLKLGRELSDEQLKQACRIAQIHDTIQVWPDGYDTRLGERGLTLSGGQRQRLAIARALLTDPELLLLDEATSALDPETERLVQEGLDGLRRGKTTIVIAHRLTAIRNADLICVMDKGVIAEQGTHDELMCSAPLYRQLVAEGQFG